MISNYIGEITTSADGSKIGLDTALQGMTLATQTQVESQITFWDRLKAKLVEIKDFFNMEFSDVLTYLLNPTAGGSVLFGEYVFNGARSLLSGKAEGGPVSAGQLFRVNDDAGHRTEMFVPSVPGTILNGDQVDRIVNNSYTSDFNGGINIYINTNTNNIDVDAVANEIGFAVQQRLRMKGTVGY